MANNFRNFMDMSLALEEEQLELNDGMSADGTIEIDEVIAMEEDIEEMTETASEIEAIDNVIDDSIEVAEDLETQVEGNEKIIEEQPETITEDQVVASQEMFFAKLGRLNFGIEDLHSKRISMEEAVAPVIKLKLSTEGIKETLAVVWDKIKAFFLKMSASIKQFVAKALVFFNRSGKVAKGLADKAKKMGEITLTEQQAENINKKVGALGKLYSKKPQDVGATTLSLIEQMFSLYDVSVMSVNGGSAKATNLTKVGGLGFKFDIPNEVELSGFIVSKKGLRGYTLDENLNVADYEDTSGNFESGEFIKEGTKYNGVSIASDLSKFASSVEKVAKTNVDRITKARKLLEDGASNASKGVFKDAWKAKADSSEESQVKVARSIMIANNRLANSIAFRVLYSMLDNFKTVTSYYSAVIK